MEEIKRFGLNSQNVLRLFEKAVERDDELTTVEMLQELLDRGTSLEDVIDFVYSKLESGKLAFDSRMVTVIANTILKKTVYPVISGNNQSPLCRHYCHAREFAETISSASCLAEIMSRYGNPFKPTINGMLEVVYASDR